MGDVLGALMEWLRTVHLAPLVGGGGFCVALAGIGLTLSQLRLFRRQLKLDALIRIMESNRKIVTLGFEYPPVWSLIEGESATITAQEALTRRRYLQLWTNHMQIMWAARQLGLVSEGEWQAYRQDLGEFLRSPALREHWASVARFYPKGFQRLVTQLIGPGDQTR